MAAPDRTGSERPADSRWSADGLEFLYESLYVAAIGGSVVALFFLAVDAVRGDPLFTPSLMGTVLFTHVAADAVRTVDLGMVAAYTPVHFGSFALLGLAVALIAREAELHSRHPVAIMAGGFLLLEVGFVAAATLGMPGVVARIGYGWVAAANGLAAMAIAIFLTSAHRPAVWNRLKHSAHLR